MKIAKSALVVAALVPVILLAACQSTAPSASPSPSSTGPSASPSDTPSPPPPTQTLPADALLGLVGTVTADNGASLSLFLVVHESKAATDPAAAGQVSAITNWCSGEMDASMLRQGYGILQVDYRAILEGSTAWPSDLPIALSPTAQNAELASSGGVHQIEVLPHARQPGDYVPHCKQSAYLTGPGTGSTFVALSGDATDTPPFTRWADFRFGFDIETAAGFVDTTPFGGASPSRAHFDSCTVTIAPLASGFGYPSASWAQEFTESHCLVGGATP